MPETMTTLAKANPPDLAPDHLVRRAQSGDTTAFAMLIDHHYDFIYRTAYKWCGQKSDAEDIAQDVCIKLATAITAFDARAQVTSWLYRVVLNAVRDMQRARSRRGRHADAFADITPALADPDQEAAATLSELWAAVRRLPEKQRDAVLLVYADDLNHAEAGTIMGCKEATVSWHIHQAKKTLRGLL